MSIKGFKTKFQLYTVPGQVQYQRSGKTGRRAIVEPATTEAAG